MYKHSLSELQSRMKNTQHKGTSDRALSISGRGAILTILFRYPLTLLNKYRCRLETINNSWISNTKSLSTFKLKILTIFAPKRLKLKPKLNIRSIAKTKWGVKNNFFHIHYPLIFPFTGLWNIFQSLWSCCWRCSKISPEPNVRADTCPVQVPYVRVDNCPGWP